MANLNPALVDVRFCPRRRADAHVVFPRSRACDACGDRPGWSAEPVAATSPRDDEGRIWLLRRALDGGGWFVELGESVEGAGCRETREELEIVVDLGALVGVYSRAEDRVVLVVCRGARARPAARNGGADRGARVRAHRSALGRAAVVVDDPGAARPLAAG